MLLAVPLAFEGGEEAAGRFPPARLLAVGAGAAGARAVPFLGAAADRRAVPGGVAAAGRIAAARRGSLAALGGTGQTTRDGGDAVAKGIEETHCFFLL